MVETPARGGWSRVLPVALIVAGAGVCGLTFAVQKGLVHGVTAEWPAYVVGAAMILFGVRGLFPPASEVRPIAPEGGPIRESGLDADDVAEVEAMDDIARIQARGRAMKPPGAGH
jgi:hypothetical protein